MPRTWKSALAPFFAGIPERTGFVGEARFFLLNDLRFGERGLPRMVDRCAALALPPGADLPAQLPVPELKVPPAEIAAWRSRRGLDCEEPACRRAGARRGRTVETLAERVLCRADPPPPRRRLCGLGAGRPRREAAGGGDRRRQPTPAISPDTTCAMPSWRWRRPRPRSPTIPASCTSPQRWARLRSVFSARPAPGIGRRSIRWRPPWRPRACSIAGPAISRPAGSATTAACATSIRTRFLPRPAARWRRSRLSVEARRRLTWYSPNLGSRADRHDSPGHRRRRLYRQPHGAMSSPMPASAWSCSTICRPASTGPSPKACRSSSARPATRRWSRASSASTASTPSSISPRPSWCRIRCAIRSAITATTR